MTAGSERAGEEVVPVEARSVRKKPDLVYEKLAEGDGGVLLDLGTGAYYHLNPLGAVVWTVLDEFGTVDELVAAVRGRLDNPPAQLAFDVRRFLNSLAAGGLISL